MGRGRKEALSEIQRGGALCSLPVFAKVCCLATWLPGLSPASVMRCHDTAEAMIVG